MTRSISRDTAARKEVGTRALGDDDEDEEEGDDEDVAVEEGSSAATA